MLTRLHSQLKGIENDAKIFGKAMGQLLAGAAGGMLGAALSAGNIFPPPAHLLALTLRSSGLFFLGTVHQH